MKPDSKNLKRHDQTQFILDALSFQVAVIDKQGVIRRVNSSWENFARENGAPEQTLKGLGMNYLKVIQKDRSPKGLKVYRGIRAVMEGIASEFDSEYPCHSPNIRRWFVMQVRALNPKGSGAVVAHYQITDRVVAEKALRKLNLDFAIARDVAVQSEKNKADFLAQMSHEIRTPVNGIIGLVEMLKDMHLDSEQTKLADQLDELGDHLIGVLNDILDFSKMEAGKLTFTKESFDPKGLLIGVRDLLFPMASHKGLELTCQTLVPFPDSVLGDALRLRQILINLIGNAIKFTDRGSVKIFAKARSNGASKWTLEFSVQDTGIGISPSAAKKIFQKFAQVKSNQNNSKPGTGLGLVISKELAKAMGGDILLNSIPGKGSVFSASVEVDAAPVTDNKKNRNALSFEGKLAKGNGRILIADDNEINRKILISILEKFGWQVISCQHGEDALARFSEASVEAIFLDCQMPEKDGYEVAREIRRQESIKGAKPVPIIAITADVLEENKQRCRDAGMDEFLPKPFRRKDILTILTKRGLVKEP